MYTLSARGMSSSLATLSGILNPRLYLAVHGLSSASMTLITSDCINGPNHLYLAAPKEMTYRAGIGQGWRHLFGAAGVRFWVLRRSGCKWTCLLRVVCVCVNKRTAKCRPSWPHRLQSETTECHVGCRLSVILKRRKIASWRWRPKTLGNGWSGNGRELRTETHLVRAGDHLVALRHVCGARVFSGGRAQRRIEQRRETTRRGGRKE